MWGCFLFSADKTRSPTPLTSRLKPTQANLNINWPFIMSDHGDTAPLLGEQRQPEYGAVEEAPPVAESRTSFKRNLGTAEAFSIIISIVIGSGIFTSPGSIDTNVPSPGFALIVWLVGGILAWTGAATMAELGTTIPGEGANLDTSHSNF
jgi:amino acid permease